MFLVYHYGARKGLFNILSKIKNMWITWLGLAGFGLLLCYDLASLNKIRNRSVLIFAGYGLQSVAIIAAALKDRLLLFPFWAVWSGWFLTIVGLLWLTYCLFFFTPVALTYRQDTPALTTAGPYSFSRHPGFVGYIVLILGLILVSRSIFLLWNGFFWIATNLLLVFIQDRLIFPRLFPGYEAYRHTTSMLIPKASTLKRFANAKLF